jgi:hypothetical protein
MGSSTPTGKITGISANLIKVTGRPIQALARHKCLDDTTYLRSKISLKLRGQTNSKAETPVPEKSVFTG